MNRYLLGVDAVVDMIAGRAPFTGWFDAQDPEALHVSTISLASVLAMAERHRQVDQRQLWRERLVDDLPARFGERLLTFDVRAVVAWSSSRLAFDGMDGPDEVDLYDAAIAIGAGLTYVARPLDWHSKLKRLKLHDPWQVTTYPT